MQRKWVKILATAMSFSMLLGGVNIPSLKASAAAKLEWKYETVTVGDRTVEGYFWYEDGVKQGTAGRGKEISDPNSKKTNPDGDWFWLDAIDGGKRAVSKDVYLADSDAFQYSDEFLGLKGKGKWVRYDKDGLMVKGWCAGKDADAEMINGPEEAGDRDVYYFDPLGGAMAKGIVLIDGKLYQFDTGEGKLIKDKTQDMPEGFHETGWNNIDGVECYFLYGVKQGVYGRGKEIQIDGQWIWLDAARGGAKVVNDDVYQENSEAGPWGDRIHEETGKRVGKWVRYDSVGEMIKGWCAGKGADAVRINNPDEANGRDVYYFDPIYGTMAKGTVTIDGKKYRFNSMTGVCEGEVSQNVYTTWQDVKTTNYKDDVQTGYTVYKYDEDGVGYPNIMEQHTYETTDGKDTETRYDIYNDNGNYLETMSLSGTNKYVTKYSYDQEGDPTGYITTCNDKNNSKAELSYEKSDGHATKLTRTYYEYEKDEWVPTSRDVYLYNEKGLTSQYLGYYYDSEKKDWKFSVREEYKYNENDDTESRTSYHVDDDGKEYKSSYTTYEYKKVEGYSSPRKVKEETTNYDSETKEAYSQRKTENKYDDKGNQTEIIRSEKDFEYKDGKRVMDAEYTVTSKTVYERDEKGRTKTQSEYESTNKTLYLSRKTEYTYQDYEVTLPGGETQKGSSQTAYDTYRYDYDTETSKGKLDGYYGMEYFYNDAAHVREKNDYYNSTTDISSEEAAKKNRRLYYESLYSYSDQYMATGEHEGNAYAATTTTTYYKYDTAQSTEKKVDYVGKTVTEYQKFEYTY